VREYAEAENRGIDARDGLSVRTTGGGGHAWRADGSNKAKESASFRRWAWKGARRTDRGELRRAFGKQDALWSAIGEAIRRLSYAEIDSMTTYATKDAYQTP